MPIVSRPVRNGSCPRMKEARPGGAALLAVGIREERAFVRDAIDVRRAIAHQTLRVGADLRDADVIAEDDENVRLARLGHECVSFGRKNVNGWAGVRWVRRTRPDLQG